MAVHCFVEAILDDKALVGHGMAMEDILSSVRCIGEANKGRRAKGLELIEMECF